VLNHPLPSSSTGPEVCSRIAETSIRSNPPVIRTTIEQPVSPPSCS